MKRESSNPIFRAFKWLGIALSPVVLFAAYVVLGQPGFSGVLAYDQAPDGTDCVVTQSWGGWIADGPYTVGFYSRKPGERWTFQYIDYETSHWASCRMTIDPARNEAKVFNGETLARTLRLQPVEFRTEENPPYLPASLQ